jgi:hypothetical protein
MSHHLSTDQRNEDEIMSRVFEASAKTGKLKCGGGIEGGGAGFRSAVIWNRVLDLTRSSDRIRMG